MLRQQQSCIDAWPVAAKALTEAEVRSIESELGDRKVRLKFLFIPTGTHQTP